MKRARSAPSTIELPELWAPTVRCQLGEIRELLQPSRVVEIQSFEEIRVSARTVEKVCLLITGERFILTSKKRCPHPAGVNGVILQKGNGDSIWLHHSLLVKHAIVINLGLSAHKRQSTTRWRETVRFYAESVSGNGEINRGLRPPQIGALHAIGSHWSLYQHPATIVMPTGTGKTETMLAALAAFVDGTMLVVVPTRPLRDQTIRKFTTLGLLRELHVLPEDVPNPIVGIIQHRPQTKEQLEPFKDCHVIIATMSSLAQGTATDFAGDLASIIDTLVVDEAHHIAARSWTAFREKFQKQKVLQFTATPFRRDGELIDGEVIYSYPLRRAQEDDYFRPITFAAVHEIDPDQADEVVATEAIARLKNDLKAGWNHLLMARCETIERAKQVHSIYERLASKYTPVLVHSDDPASAKNLDKLRRFESRVVVCVDMLGEGFDLPELKIAAVHDTHKSLAVLLQFTGRFTRSKRDTVGNATVVANIADLKVSSALERLYSEDADWNALLSEFSSQAVKEHKELIAFLNSSERLDESQTGGLQISHHLLRPKFSTAVYECTRFHAKKFHEAISKSTTVQAVWLHSNSNTLYFVTRSEPPVQWTRSKEVFDRQWDLFVVHFDDKQKLLYVNSTDKSTMHEDLANAVGGAVRLIQGDVIFRALGGINRLVFQNIGVRKVGRRNLRYAKYTGADVKQALTLTQTSGSVKSDLSGTGYEGGGPVTIGCSVKGRVWSKRNDTIRLFVDWCQTIGAKLKDDTIDTTKILENVLIPDEIGTFPDSLVLSIDWPMELLRQSEEKVTLGTSTEEIPITLFEIEVDGPKPVGNRLLFRVASETYECHLALVLGVQRGFEVKYISGEQFSLKAGHLAMSLESFLSDYPPLIKFADMSELDGNLLVKPQEARDLTLPPERFEAWDWTGVDITSESMWRAGKKRKSSIQEHVAARYAAGGYTVVFDDDAKGEAADLVCLKDEGDTLALSLIHCKFSQDSDAGKRLGDVVEVCSQAIRSAKWKWRFRELVRHVLLREKRLRKTYRSTRFLTGDTKELNRFLQMSRFKNLNVEVTIAQPGISKDACTTEQSTVLAAADSFLLETIGVKLSIICSE